MNAVIDTAERRRRHLQVEAKDDVFVPAAGPTAPKYEIAAPRLKKFGGDMKNISYPEMVQLSETLAFHLHEVAGITVGPHDLAQALFRTVETMDALPTEKAPETGKSQKW
jgi:hypothetical protein